MSLFGSIQMAGNTLQAMQIGLHVVGNNIANANTPGYVRERAIFTPAPVQQLGKLTLGLGVEVEGIIQSVDRFIEDRLRDAGSDTASADVQEKIYRDLQAILGELTDSDISSSIANFFNALDQVTLTPEDVAIRDLAVRAGQQLTTAINTLDRRVRTVDQDFSSRVVDIGQEINTLTETIRDLNLKIVQLEGGGGTGSEAGALRSQRNVALKDLAKLIDIRVSERETGVVNVSVGGEFLVFEGTSREVAVELDDEDSAATATIHFADNGSQLNLSGGELHGILEARDTILGGFLDRLDEFAAALAFEFNQVYSQGQAINGFTELTSLESVDDASAPLDAAGLDFTATNGSFNLLVRTAGAQPGDPALTTTHTILVDLNGLDGDLSLAGLASAIDAIDGVAASVDFDNRLVINSESSDIDFAFSGDTSGVLAALGINTFFTGSTARLINVNQLLLDDGTKFAASSTGIGVAADNVLNLIELNDRALSSLDGASLTGAYDQLINETTQGATIAAAVAEGLNVFESTLDASAQAVSGVNLDEEAIDMILLQRAYQASARYITTISELLDVLVNI